MSLSARRFTPAGFYCATPPKGSATTETAFADLCKIDHAPITEKGHTPVTPSKSEMLTPEEFASLLTVGNTSFLDPPAVIPAEHSARLIALGYMADLDGRLRMTTPGRSRIAAGFETP